MQVRVRVRVRVRVNVSVRLRCHLVNKVRQSWANYWLGLPSLDLGIPGLPPFPSHLSFPPPLPLSLSP